MTTENATGLCMCAPTALCDRCLERDFSWIAGTAMAQGIYWADRVAWRLGGCSEPWPAWGGRAEAIARRKQRDRDPRLAERLARACYDRAPRRWDELRAEPVELARLLTGRMP